MAPPRVHPASSEVRARLARLADEPLPPEVWKARLDAPIGADQMTSMRELIRWFLRRYPTPAQRLAYAGRATARWRR